MSDFSQRMRRLSRLFERSLAFFDQAPRQSELVHMPFTLRRALILMIKTKEVNRNRAKGFFHDRFVLYVGQPRSGSTAGGHCTSVIQRNLGPYRSEIFPKSSYGLRAYAGYMARNHDSELRPEMFIDFPEGGVLKFHPAPTSSNLKVIEDHGFKYLIHFRNPADQLANFYTYGRLVNKGTIGGLAADSGKNNWVWNHIHPVKKDLFRSGHDIDETINHLIRHGYLHHLMLWMLKWTILRDPDKSMIVRWEDFKTDPRETLDRIARFTCQAAVDEPTLKECQKILGPLERAVNMDTEVYPRGYTGPIGCHQNYFSKANSIAYREVVAQFLDIMPEADKLLSAVPEIISPEFARAS